MKCLIVLLVTTLVAGSAVRADEVAVFELQWGKGKQRQVRSFALDFDEKAAPYTVNNLKKLVRGKFYIKPRFIELSRTTSSKAEIRSVRRKIAT